MTNANSTANSTAPEPEALRIQRRYDASPSRIYRYFTQAEHFAEWFGPERVTCELHSFDVRVGGEYCLTFHEPDGSTIGLSGRFLELEESQLIQMTWQWKRTGEEVPDEETLVTVRLIEVGTGTLLQLVHERFGEVDERDRHGSGWTSSFICLARALGESKVEVGP